jgi:hypothetical protein
MTPAAAAAVIDAWVAEKIRDSAVTRAGNEVNRVWEAALDDLKARFSAALGAPAGKVEE